jgi:hypothetical protein
MRRDRRRVHEVYRLHNTLCLGCVIGALVGLGWGKALLGRRPERERRRREGATSLLALPEFWSSLSSSGGDVG